MRLLLTGLAFVTLNISLSAFALPGWNIQDLRGWIEKHPFLTPRLSMGGENIYFAKRTIKGGFVVTVEFKGKPTKDRNTVVLNQTNLTLQAGEEAKNIWVKSHEAGRLILTNVFGKEFVEDYQTSQFQYSGIEYTLKSDKIYQREKIASIYANLGTNKPPFEIVPWGRASFYKGYKYGYEIFEKFNSNKKELYEFRVYPLNQLQVQIKTMENNAKMHNKLNEWKKRFQPAEIKIE